MKKVDSVVGNTMVEQKFQIGQVIKHKNDPDSDAGEIIAFSFTPERGYLYTISIDEWNPETRKPFKAVKHIFQDEAIEVKEKENE